MSSAPATLLSSSTGTYETTSLKRVEYGIGSLERLSVILSQFSVTRAFVVTGNHLANKTDVIRQVKKASTTGGKAEVVHVFHGIGQHAPINDVRKAVDILRDLEVDGIIAVGGGSPIDSGKHINLELKKATGKLLPLICIPTTLSAAEMSIVAGSTSEEGKKTTEVNPALSVSAVIYDAKLSLSTPNELWLPSGIRALDHAIEQQVRPGAPLPVLVLCREAASTLFTSLPACAANKKDVEARQRALNAAWLSLWPDNLIGPLGLSHSLGYNLGSPYGIPHGMCSVLTLVPTVRVLAQHLKGDELERLAGVLPLVSPKRAEMGQYRSARERAEALANVIQDLLDGLGLKARLSDYNVPKQDLEEIARRSMDSIGKKDELMFRDVVEALNDMY